MMLGNIDMICMLATARLCSLVGYVPIMKSVTTTGPEVVFFVMNQVSFF